MWQHRILSAIISLCYMILRIINKYFMLFIRQSVYNLVILSSYSEKRVMFILMRYLLEDVSAPVCTLMYFMRKLLHFRDQTALRRYLATIQRCHIEAAIKERAHGQRELCLHRELDVSGLKSSPVINISYV